MQIHHSRKKHFTAWILVLAMVLAGSVLMSCGEAEKPAETAKEAPAKATEPIRMGVAGPHSGDLASYGIPTVKAAELVVEQRNASGGIAGRKIELVVEDDVCKPEIATNTATKLVADEVDVVLGHICSGATKAALGIYKESKIPVMSPSATNPGLTQSGDYPNFFRTIASDDAQARLEVDFALAKLNLKKIAVLHDKGDYGKGLAEFAKSFLEQDARGEVVLYEGITPGAVDYSAVVQKIKNSGADGVIFGGYHPEASKIVTAMRKKGMDTFFISDDGVKDDTFIKVAKEYAEGVYATGPVDTTQNPMAVEAIERHRKKYGEDPGAFFLNAYAAAVALLNAIEKSNATDFDSVTNALRTEFVGTPLGILRFDERGDAIGVGFAMYQVQKGQYVEIK
ncbi:Branched-chain amino acid ABC transporter, substrate-binding protein LivJ (TC 3.A.1.4.1) [Olavius algarvensis associated proteobacterium Delta 3]|nr:Branched-chain amino acid ABC transporter, substrate-binding protein LivJ (TC 3.A.1.4.1) [Olavius algarvensis associated proteobacterium Delta 3]